MNSASINYGTGVLIITASETIDTTPGSRVDVNRLFISDAQNANNISLNGQTATEDDEVTVTITFNEVVRIASLLVSGTSGGNGDAAFLDVEPLTFIDIGQNNNQLTQSLQLIETPDIIQPTFSSDCKFVYRILPFIFLRDHSYDTKFINCHSEYFCP